MAEGTPAVEPSTTEAQAPEARTYTEAEHKAAVEAAVKGRFSKYADYDELKSKASKLAEIEAAQMSEIEKAQKAAEAAKAELEAERSARKAAELASLKLKVGTEKGLTAELIKRLAGEDEASIAADAELLLAALPKPPKSGANPARAAESGSDDDDPFIAGLKKFL